MSSAAFLLLFLSFPAAAETLTLEDAMRRAVERSPEAVAARARRDSAALEEPFLLSNLDPKVFGSFRYEDDRSPRTLPAFQGSRSRLERWETGLSQYTLIGTQAKVAWRAERLVNPSAFRPVDPTVDSRLALELKQGLLRNFWGRPDKARRARARAGTAAAEADFSLARAAAAGAAASSVIELRAARQLIAIREEAVADARLLLKRTEEKRKYGAAEDTDRLQARASFEAAETELLLALSAAERARHALAAALRADSPAELDASTGPLRGLPADADLPADEAEALAYRPELDAARRRRDAFASSARLARLDALPDLSLDASYIFAGLDSRTRAAWKDMTTWRHPVAAIGASVSVPLGFWQERLARKRADLALKEAEALLAGAENEARRAWRDGRETLRLARKRLAAAATLEDVERLKMRAGESDFRSGRATTDLIVRFHQDLRRARAERVRAEADAALAAVDLARQLGRLGAGL